MDLVCIVCSIVGYKTAFIDHSVPQVGVYIRDDDRHIDGQTDRRHNKTD